MDERPVIFAGRFFLCVKKEIFYENLFSFPTISDRPAAIAGETFNRHIVNRTGEYGR